MLSSYYKSESQSALKFTSLEFDHYLKVSTLELHKILKIIVLVLSTSWNCLGLEMILYLQPFIPN